MQLPTQIIHHPYTAPTEFEASMPPVAKASSVFFPNMQAVRERQWLDRSGYTYGLHGTPTSYTLEKQLCTLEGGKHALLLPSGLAAIACVNFALLHSGDEVLIPDNAYDPSKSLAEAELAHWGISYRYYNALDVSDLENKISSKTKLVWLEAAGSVTLEFPDLIAQAKLCRSKGILTALDNTWGAGLAFNAFDLERTGNTAADALGVDITVHALTKYPCGGGDVLMGSVVTRSDSLAKRLNLSHARIGFGVGMNDVETILRGLPSMQLRYQTADKTARSLAQWCAQQQGVVQVLHPALDSGVGHANWQAVCTSAEQPQGHAASLFTLVLNPSLAAHKVDAFCDALRLFRLGYSWGGFTSMVMQYNLSSMRTMASLGVKAGTLVRFAIGLENESDLQADLAAAFTELG